MLSPALSVRLLQELEDVMKHSKLVETTDWSVTTAAGDEMLFRIEILSEVKAQRDTFWARLYRLEFLRFSMSASASEDQNDLRTADYRIWVCDDNFDLESVRSPSGASARNHAIAQLSSQLGVPISRRKVRAAKGRSSRRR